MRRTTFQEDALAAECRAKPGEGLEMTRPVGLCRLSQRCAGFGPCERFGNLRERCRRAFEPAELKLRRRPRAFSRTGAGCRRYSGLSNFQRIGPCTARRRKACFKRGKIGRGDRGRRHRRRGNAGARSGRRRFGRWTAGCVRRTRHARQRGPFTAAVRTGAEHQGNGQKSRESKVSHRGGTIEVPPLSRKHAQTITTVQTRA